MMWYMWYMKCNRDASNQNFFWRVTWEQASVKWGFGKLFASGWKKNKTLNKDRQSLFSPLVVKELTVHFLFLNISSKRHHATETLIERWDIHRLILQSRKDFYALHCRPRSLGSSPNRYFIIFFLLGRNFNLLSAAHHREANLWGKLRTWNGLVFQSKGIMAILLIVSYSTGWHSSFFMAQ